MKEIFYYEFFVGTTRFDRWGLDDKKANRLLARYLRLVYSKKEPHSICPMTCGYYRTWSSCGGFVPYKGRRQIVCFELSEEPIKEFCRVAK